MLQKTKIKQKTQSVQSETGHTTLGKHPWSIYLKLNSLSHSLESSERKEVTTGEAKIQNR